MDKTKILHLCFSGYSEGYAYQENLLTQYHQKMGLDVYIFASNIYRDSKGQEVRYPKPQEYLNQYGVKVKTFAYKKPERLNRRLQRFQGLATALEQVSPDIIFMHGIQWWDSLVVLKYVKKHSDVRLFVDNHSDFSNSATNWISKEIQHKILWRYCAQKLNPYVTKFYGVLPARVDFLVNMYKLPKEKVELLVMGVDDELVEKYSAPGLVKETRSKLGINDSEFLIVTGGKIDQWKRQTLLLMDAVNQLSENASVRLVVFGSVIPELKDEVLKRCSDKVQYIGWLSSEETYRYLVPADLVVFPGRHSVLWEQTAGVGKPMIVKYWEGTTHVDKGGNVSFLYEDSVEEIKQAILSAMDSIQEMKKNAEKNKRHFGYGDIARRSLG